MNSNLEQKKLPSIAIILDNLAQYRLSERNEYIIFLVLLTQDLTTLQAIAKMNHDNIMNHIEQLLLSKTQENIVINNAIDKQISSNTSIN